MSNTSVSLKSFLADPSNILVLDGAMGTELEVRGCDVNDPLWSGKVLMEQPELIVDVEDSYLQAGARCLITASYQTSPLGLMTHRGLSAEEAAATVRKTVELAQTARSNFVTASKQRGETPPPVFIAGSCGPFGAFLADGSEFSGNYHRDKRELQDFHRPHIAALLSGGVDILAFETQPSANETRAVVELLAEEFPDALAWISFTTSPEHPTTHLADGTPFEEIVPLVDASPQMAAVGVNCVPLGEATGMLQNISKLTKKPLVVYPNSGEVYDGITKEWRAHGDPTLTLANHCEAWVDTGARVIGGCCRTGPRDIRCLATRLEAISSARR